MEVHHHSHTDRKKFTHYLWEFLMLFLAVFCGFLAENMREHSVDLRKEKEYMHSLVQDLKTDIIDIDSNIQRGAIVTEKLDSLIYILNNEDPDKNILNVYRLAQLAGRIIMASFEDRTSSQLKNSGSMRLVRNPELSDSIRSYWSHVKIDESISSRLLDIQAKSGDLAMKIINNKYYATKDPANPLNRRNVGSDAKFINNDPKLLAEFSNHANHRLIVLYNYLINLRKTKEEGQRLIAAIEKEYHWK